MTNLVFENIPVEENNDPMVNLADYPFDLSPMYFEWGLSDSPELWVRKEIADRLLKIQNDVLAPMNRQFRIWDPWRSRIVQDNIYQQFWNKLKKENPDWDNEKLKFEVGVFVTKADNLDRIPPHATGGSIDLTVLENGQEIDFGTEFDHFGPESATLYYEENEGNETAKENRRWLHDIMIEAGFETDPDEWWHFDYGNQKWAVQSNQPVAFYGEITNPVSKPEVRMKHAL